MTYAQGDWTTELEMRAAMAEDASALFAALYPVAAWDGFATDLHISTTTDAEPIGSESGQLSALVLILRGTAEWGVTHEASTTAQRAWWRPVVLGSTDATDARARLTRPSAA